MSPKPRRLPRRTFLRAAGACIALPFLEAMIPRTAQAEQMAPRRFFGFFYPNGKDSRFWNPPTGPLRAETLPEMLRDLSGFGAEGIWPALSASVVPDITVVKSVDHNGVSSDIHVPSLALSAHKGMSSDPHLPGAPTLDQVIASSVQGTAPYRSLCLSATNTTDLKQGFISFRDAGTPASVIREPRALFDQLFVGTMTDAEVRRAARHTHVLDRVLGDANRIKSRVGAADRARLEQYYEAIHELNTQLASTANSSCRVPDAPQQSSNWHDKSKAFMDLAALAMACDLTRVVTLQYSNSWGVNYADYMLGSGLDSLGQWSDHFISHKLGDRDRATDLDGVSDAAAIADRRVILASRFKVRRFAYLVDKLKSIQTPTGTLFDESLAMYCSENADGDSHSRRDMPILLAGHAGGFKTGRSFKCADDNRTTGALHASVLKYFDIHTQSYGNPAGSPIVDL